MCSVGNQEHFGIFDDGWFFLDPSGRWTEVGMQNIEGKQVPLWKETFYNMLDMDYRHRIVVNYDGRYIRIAFTAKTYVGSTDEDFVDLDNQEVWVFDPRGNRVFRDTYPVTCWAEANANIREAVDWDELTTSWSDLEGSWLSLAAKFSLKNLNHGTTAGYVLVHDYDIITKFNTDTGLNTAPSFAFTGILSSLGDPTELKTALKLWLEYIHTGGGSVSLEVSGNPSDGQESGTISYSTSANAGDIELLFRTFRFTAANIRFSISGTAPVMMRSILADIAVKGTQTGDYASAPAMGGGPKRGR
jgi:hypothetical protein